MPTSAVFCLTILVCLIAVFIIVVCQYNYVVSFRSRVPYKTFLPECFFPKCINEKSALAMLEKQRSNLRDGHEFLDDDM